MKLFTHREEVDGDEWGDRECDIYGAVAIDGEAFGDTLASDGAPAPSPPPFGRAASPPIPIPATGVPHPRSWEFQALSQPVPTRIWLSIAPPLCGESWPPSSSSSSPFVAAKGATALQPPAQAVRRRSVRFGMHLAWPEMDPDTEGMERLEL